MILPLLASAMLTACNQQENRDEAPEKEAIHVTTVMVKSEKVITTLQYSGTIEPYQTIPLTFQTTGTIQSVLVEAGDVVKKGTLLATIDPTDAKNMYEITLSQYQQAKDAYDRLKTVHEKGSLPDIKWVEMESKLDQAKASLNLAKNNLEKCKLYAPVDGLVGRRNSEPGMAALSLAAAPIELVDIRKVYVKISVPENELGKVVKGMKCSFTVAALDDKEFEGSVAIITPVADRISRTYEAKILVPNANLTLKPGMVCDVHMEQSMEKEMLIIPYRCVSKDADNHTYVFLVDPSSKKARKQIIQTGGYQGDGIGVISGLEPGQSIVYGGKEKLSDNRLISW